MQKSHVWIVIPARYASSRLPAKMLLKETGRTLVQHVCDNARRAKRASRVLVATDDDRIAGEVRLFGGEAVMTSPDCPSGTDRIAEALDVVADPASPVRTLPDIVVNLQGDEPQIDPSIIDGVIQALIDHPEEKMATAVTRFRSLDQVRQPQQVKAVLNTDGHAVWFSRSPIPYLREKPEDPLSLYWRHIGIYAYRREFLERFVAMPPGKYEMAEGLEQLRALEAGVPIRAIEVEYDGIAIDTREDYDRFVNLEGRS